MNNKLSAAKTAVVLDQPFFGVLVCNLNFREDPTCQTAWTDGTTLGYNPTYIDSLQHSEIVGLICHEVLHCAGSHPYRRDGREPRKWNMACLAEGTSILMADGSHKAVESIPIGSFVASPDGPSKVLGVMNAGMEHCVHLGYNASNLWCTRDHRILTDRGLVHAETAEGYRGVYLNPEKQYSGNEFYFGKLSEYGIARFMSCDKSEVCGNSPISLQERTTSEPAKFKTLQHSGILRTISDRGSILGRDNRWRRNTIYSSEQQTLLPALDINSQYRLESSSVDEAKRILWELLCKQCEPGLLADSMEWIRTHRYAVFDSALFDNQSSAHYTLIRAYLNSLESTQKRTSDGTYVTDCLRNKGFESARISVQGQSRAAKAVYDIITEKQYIIAEGLVVHNCDYAINPIVKESNMVLPEGSLQPLPEWIGKSAEYIYDRLPDLPPDQNGTGSGDGAPGEVRDSPGTDPDAGKDSDTQPKTDGEWQEITRQAATQAKAQGNCPASMDRFAQAAAQSRVDWKAALRKFIEQNAKADYSWSHPSSRYISQGLYLPGLHSESMPKVSIAVDTSGSMDDIALAKAKAEVLAVIDETQPSSVDVLYADARVARVDTFQRGESIDFKPAGGGGTDFRPVFEAVQAMEEQPACIIYITDMYGSFPESSDVPTLWVTDSDIVGPFGDTIKIQ